LVGSAHYNVFGSQGSDAHVKIEHHPSNVGGMQGDDERDL